VKRFYWRLVSATVCRFRGHLWRAEKEFASCARCHTCKAMRDFEPGEFTYGR
jgi:hypothetical protein